MIIYHANCTDGWTAAWAYLQGLPEHHGEQLVPMAYGDDMPDIKTGDCVVFLDFWPGSGRLKQLAERAGHILVLDHHATAQEDWTKHQHEFSHHPIDVVFDQTRSGALLAWEFWFAATPPALVSYVSDNDIWAHKLPESRVVTSYIQSWEHSMENWNRLSQMSQEELIEISKESWRVKQHICSIAAKNAYEVEVRCGSKTTTAAVINIGFPTTQDVLNRLLESYDMSIGYCRMKDGKWKISVRTNPGAKISAKDYAESHQGGGHENAAGYVCNATPIYLM